MSILFLITGIILGFVICWLFLKSNYPSGEHSEKIIGQQKNELDSERERVLRLSSEVAEWKIRYKNLDEKLASEKNEIEELQKKFTAEFEIVANRLLDDKSKKFVEQNRTNLDVILTPLKEKIKDFEDKVDKAYKAEAAERNTLKGEIKNLMELNKQISEEAGNLTKALKGDAKKQGNWGEIILEKILERSGLIKDHEYKMQVSASNEEGKRIQPDAVVYLPDNKHIIIDSKVSLVAYDAFTSATDEPERERHLKEHLLSVKNHVKSLSEKSYQSSPDFIAPDFVLLFIPIESSFAIAVQADIELFGYAWDKKIIIVSPTTLLATLRTIASIWKQERQTRNVLEIARQSGALYDKFVGFVEDLIAVGKKMNDAKTSYEDAMKKLHSGSGNLVKKVEAIRELGANTSKAIPQALVDRAKE